MRYVKICPNGHENEEASRKCPRCGELLGMIPTTSIEDPGSVPVGEPAENGPDSGAAALADVGADDRDTSEPTPPQVSKTHGIGKDRLGLQFVGGARIFYVRTNQIIGRDDGSADPNRVSIPADTGVDVGYVSRWHCRFHFEHGRWYVEPLDPRSYPSELKQANPTFLGAEMLPVGQRYPLNNGDRLTLADVELRIMILGDPT